MLFDRTALDRLYRYAYALCGHEALAYDLVQDTIERCLQHPPDELVNPEAYARKVMRNRFIDLTRRDAKAPVHTGINDDAALLAIDTHCLEDLLVNRDQLERIWSLLDTFEREILYYWAVEDMTAAQIAATLGSKRGTILSRIHRLRNRLEHELNTESAGSGGGQS